MAANLGLKIIEWVNRLARRLAAKPNAEGIMTIPNRQVVIDTTNEILTKFKKHGVPNDMIRSENDVKAIYNQILNLEEQQLRRNVISPGDPRHKEITEKLLGKKKTTADLIDLGLVKKGKNVKKTTPKEAVDPKLVEEVKVKETFEDATKRFNQTDIVADTVTKIKTMEPVAALKEANSVIGRKGIYKNLTKEQSQKILKDTDDWIFQRDPDDLYDYNKKRPFRDDPDVDPQDFAYGGVAGLLGEPTYQDDSHRVPYENAGKVSLDDIIGKVIGEKEPPQLRKGVDMQRMGQPGRYSPPTGGLQEVLDIQEEAKVDKNDQNTVLAIVNYALENADQELAENMLLTLGEGALKVSAQTTVSGYKLDLFEKAGLIPIDGETLYQAVIDTDLFNKFNLDAVAIADAVGTQELLGTLKYNNLGLTWNSATGEMEGAWEFNKTEGPANQETRWTITPKISKNDMKDSQEISLSFDRAVNNGEIQFNLSDKADSGGENRTLKFNWTGKEGEDGKAETVDITHLTKDSGNELNIDAVKSFDFYNIDGRKPTFSLDSTHYLDKGDENYLASAVLPLPNDFSLYGKKGSDQESSYGIGYRPSWEIDNWFTKEKGGDNTGIFSVDAHKNLASGDWGTMFNFRMPLGKNKLRKKPLNFDNYDIKPSLIKDHVKINDELVFMPEKEQFEYKQDKEFKDDYKYYSGTDELKEAWDIYENKPWIPKERSIRMIPKNMAKGGIARLGFKEGKGPKMSRRNFLKLMGGLASIPIIGKLFKFAKPLAKTAKVADVTSVPIKTGVDGMPAWFKPLVNRVIKEGEEVSSGAERVITHKTKLPNSKTDVYVNQDLNTGDVWVDIGVQKHGFVDGKFGQPVRLEYKASEWIEPAKGKKGVKTKDEFNVEEAEFTGGHPENVKFEETSVNKFGQHESNFDEVEMFATGKKKKTRNISSLQKQDEDLADHFSNYPTPDDFASGGIARMLGE